MTFSTLSGSMPMVARPSRTGCTVCRPRRVPTGSSKPVSTMMVPAAPTIAQT
jgi:hypothetical protein